MQELPHVLFEARLVSNFAYICKPKKINSG